LSDTIVCIAGGPSLTREDAQFASSVCTTIGVNDAYRIARLDVLYASDHPWWKHHWDAVKDLPCRKVCGEQKEKAPEGVETVPAKHGNDLTDSVLNFGGNSGFAALHLAILMGAKRVVLLGYDMKAGAKRHWFGNHPEPLSRNSNYATMVHRMESAPKPDIPIINCSRDTALTCFPRARIEDVL